MRLPNMPVIRFRQISAIFPVIMFAFAVCLGAQTMQTAPSQPPASKSRIHHKAKITSQKQEPDTPVPPPEPEKPHWPINEKANAATITWDKQGLHITADNADMRQILDDVATAIGATIEGIPPDQRVYGNYGPGLARDVLSQLLNGSGYNVVMTGDSGSGAPKTIILTRKDKKAPTAPNTNTPPSNDDDTSSNNSPQDLPNGQQQFNRILLLECPAYFEPVRMRETGPRGA